MNKSLVIAHVPAAQHQTALMALPARKSVRRETLLDQVSVSLLLGRLVLSLIRVSSNVFLRLASSMRKTTRLIDAPVSVKIQLTAHRTMSAHQWVMHLYVFRVFRNNDLTYTNRSTHLTEQGHNGSIEDSDLMSPQQLSRLRALSIILSLSTFTFG